MGLSSTNDSEAAGIIEAELRAAIAVLEAEVEQLQRENGALARVYALAEEKLRERTETLNDAQSEVTTLEWKLSEASKAAEQFRTALERIEAGFHMRMSAAELASIARRAL
jgi:predicted RNase H-like nuclease (RuvC/YqgF family)